MANYFLHAYLNGIRKFLKTKPVAVAVLLTMTVSANVYNSYIQMHIYPHYHIPINKITEVFS